MLEDGWVLPMYCIFSLRTAYKPLAQEDEDKSEMLLICSREIRQWQRSKFNKHQTEKRGVSVTTETSLFNHALFLSLFLSLSLSLFRSDTHYIIIFLTTILFFFPFFLFPRHHTCTHPSLPSFLSVTGWKQQRDKEANTRCGGRTPGQISHWHVCQVTMAKCAAQTGKWERKQWDEFLLITHSGPCSISGWIQAHTVPPLRCGSTDY